MKCKDCKYWKRGTTEWREWGEYYGDCKNEKFKYADPNGWDDIENVEKDNLIYEDYEGYQAYFTTGQDFGCIHYEAE